MDKILIYCVPVDALLVEADAVPTRLLSPVDVLGSHLPTVVMPANMLDDAFLVKTAATVAAATGTDPDFVEPYAIQVVPESEDPDEVEIPAIFTVRRGHSRQFCELNGISYEAEARLARFEDPISRNRGEASALYEAWICVIPNEAAAQQRGECSEAPQQMPRLSIAQCIQVDAALAFKERDKLRFEELRGLLLGLAEYALKRTGTMRISDALAREFLEYHAKKLGRRLDRLQVTDSIASMFLAHFDIKTAIEQCQHYLNQETANQNALAALANRGVVVAVSRPAHFQ